MAFGRNKDNNGPPQQERPNLPVDYAPKSKRYAEEALRSAQHVLDLESSLKEAEHERDSMRAALEAVKHDNQRLEDRNIRLTEERDVYKGRVSEIEARFDDVAALILRVLDHRLTKQPDRTRDSVAEAHDAIERALTDPNAPDVQVVPLTRDKL